jgi:hypothetical protein
MGGGQHHTTATQAVSGITQCPRWTRILSRTALRLRQAYDEA